jgi:hypothetical protein
VENENSCNLKITNIERIIECNSDYEMINGVNSVLESDNKLLVQTHNIIYFTKLGRRYINIGCVVVYHDGNGLKLDNVHNKNVLNIDGRREDFFVDDTNFYGIGEKDYFTFTYKNDKEEGLILVSQDELHVIKKI